MRRILYFFLWYFFFLLKFIKFVVFFCVNIKFVVIYRQISRYLIKHTYIDRETENNGNKLTTHASYLMCISFLLSLIIYF